jgi:hypothetical protein
MGIVSSILDVTPEESAMCLIKLDILAAQLIGNSYVFTWPTIANMTDGTLNDSWELEDYAVMAIVQIFAAIICTDFGKPLTQSLLSSVNAGYNTLSTNSIIIPSENLLPPFTPMGAGNKYYGVFAGETTNYSTL